MIRHLVLAAVAATYVCAAPTRGLAAPHGEKLSDAELADFRGGFVVVDGLTLDFTADLSTFIDGQLALQSHLGLDGATSTGANLSPGQLSALTGGALRVDLGSGKVFLSQDGATAAIHQFDGQLTNVLINTADNRMLRQELNLTLNLPGFEATQRGLDVGRFGRQITDQVDLFAAGLR